MTDRGLRIECKHEAPLQNGGFPPLKKGGQWGFRAPLFADGTNQKIPPRPPLKRGGWRREPGAARFNATLSLQSSILDPRSSP